MTSLSLADATVRPAANADRAGAVRPAASEEAVRLALQLRDAPASAEGRVLLFVPASAPGDASFTVADALYGLLELHERPVLILDLRPADDGAGLPTWLRRLTADDEAGGGWSAGTSDIAIVARPFAHRRDNVPYAASTEFAARLAEARTKYAYILCIGGHISTSVETLVLAPQVDAVVLTVLPGQLTRSHMLQLTDRLRRARAYVRGFVVDERSSAPSRRRPFGFRPLRVRVTRRNGA